MPALHQPCTATFGIPGLAGFFHQIDAPSGAIQINPAISFYLVRSRGDVAYSSPFFFSSSRCARISTRRRDVVDLVVDRALYYYPPHIMHSIQHRGPRQSRRNHCTPSSLCIAFRRRSTSRSTGRCAHRGRRGASAHIYRYGSFWLIKP